MMQYSYQKLIYRAKDLQTTVGWALAHQFVGINARPTGFKYSLNFFTKKQTNRLIHSF